MKHTRHPFATLRGALALPVVTALAVATGAPAIASTDPSTDPATLDHTPPGKRGKLQSASPVEGAAALPSADANRRVTYTSQDADGGSTTVSGTVSLPEAPPPPGGWPVVSWAHGTTGTANECAPSADTSDGPAHDYLALMDETLDEWVSSGFVVVQTDYEGLGTPGGHPYLNGPSAANTVTDIVRAARDLDPRVGRDWVTAGHSQGGHAALFTAAQQERRHDINLLGAVAIAPGGIDVSETVSYIESGGPGVAEALPFLTPILLGAAAAEPEIVPEELLTEEAQPLLEAGRNGCMDEAAEAAAQVPADNVFRPGADLRPLTSYLRQQEPSGLTPRVPTFVAQGADDSLVPEPDTAGLVEGLCERSDQLTYQVYADDGHREAVASSYPDAREFVSALRNGGEPGSTC